MRRVLNGGETALGTLYDRYSVFGCQPHSRDTEAAEEVLQDIFHQIWRTARGSTSKAAVSRLGCW